MSFQIVRIITFQRRRQLLGGKLMPEKERLYHDLATLRETIKFNWQDVQSKQLSENDRAALRTHVEACIADLRSLLGKV
ncbi:MAG: hypothetical protein M3N39_03930 [Pseudomonadota bacterium]|nr:hypothetical protein [Pseudomonadota bacterium]